MRRSRPRAAESCRYPYQRQWRAPVCKSAEKIRRPLPNMVLRLLDLEQSKKRGAEFTSCAKFSRIVPSRDGRIHRLVLL